MASTLNTSRTDATARRDHVRTQLGRKTAAEILAWSSLDVDRAWAELIALRLRTTGYLTLADLTDDEFDDLLV
jgi:hypothetical protein